ncbi:MAG TPA: ROK family protein [Chthoniobacterales bacterium]|nr:ROK family protein [Chthoniobacterales bacterium]
MRTDYSNDSRIVLTLDGGGTSFRFSATQGNRSIVETIILPSSGDNLDRCLANIVEGFDRAKAKCPQPPVAISFAFPGPADYPNGVIGDLQHLPAFRGGVPLGPILEERFGVPVFINNDGDLFVYGEAIAGFLPWVNGLLEQAGNPKRYQNLFGVTLGTGFGGGLVRRGELFLGDNSLGAEIWLLRNKLNPQSWVEEATGIRAVRRVYAEKAAIPLGESPEPKVIFAIGQGQHPGDKAAAREAFRQLGEVVGDALAQALTIVDGLAVVGGGLSGAWPLFSPALMAELNGSYAKSDGEALPRLIPEAFNLEDPEQRRNFLQTTVRQIPVPGSPRRATYDPRPRLGVGLSRLGTSEAVAIGAYAFALQRLV